MKEQGIEEIFKSAFNHFEADVDPSVWTNVQHAINTPAPAPSGHGANGSIAGKAGAMVQTIVAIVAAVTAVSVGTYFVLSDTQNKKTILAVLQSWQQPPMQVIPQQQTYITEEPHARVANPTTAPSRPHGIPDQKTKADKKQDVRASVNATQPSVTTTATVAKNNTNNPPVSFPPSSHAKPQTSSPAPAATANADKPSEDAIPSENHTYQNAFADINDYLEMEPSTGKAALPNAFSPNGDGRNDVFRIHSKNLISLAVTIFDISGKLIYQWNGPDGEWDGNLYDGRPAPVGNYYYSLLAETVDGKRCIASSPLMLRR